MPGSRPHQVNIKAPSLRPGPTSPGREVFVGREIQRGVEKMIAPVSAGRRAMFENKSGIADHLLGDGLCKVSQGFFNGLAYNIQRGILEGYDRKHGTNMCARKRYNGRYRINDRSFYNRCYNDIHDYENACDRALFGVDHRRCGIFGPTACRQVWGCPCSNRREYAPVPYIACPPLHRCCKPKPTVEAKKEQKELKKEVEKVGEKAKRLPEIKLAEKIGDYQVQTLGALQDAIEYQNDAAPDSVDNSQKAEQIGADTKEHAIANYIQHQIYKLGRTADSISFDVQGQVVKIDGHEFNTGNPVNKESVFNILHKEVLIGGGVIDNIATSIHNHASGFNKSELNHYYEQTVGPHFQTPERFKAFLENHVQGDSKQKEALKFMLKGNNKDALQETMVLTRNRFSKMDKSGIAGNVMIKDILTRAGSTNDQLFNFDIKNNAQSPAFRTGLAIATVIGIFAAPVLLYKAFKKNSGMTWAGIATLLLGIPLITGKGVFSTTKEMWNTMLDIDGMDGIVGSKREDILGADERVSTDKEAFAEFFLGQSPVFRDGELSELSGGSINTNPTTQKDKNLNGIRILLKMTAHANNMDEDKLIDIIKEGRDLKLNRLRISEITKDGTGFVRIHYGPGKSHLTNTPWTEKAGINKIGARELTKSASLFPQLQKFEDSFKKLEDISRANDVFNESGLINASTNILNSIAPHVREGFQSLGIGIENTGVIIHEGVSWSYDVTKKAFINSIWPGIKLVAEDGKLTIKKVAGDSYLPIKEFIRDDVGGAIKVVGKDAYEGIDMIFNAATKSLDHIMVTNYAGVGPLIVKAGEVGADIIEKMYKGGMKPALGKILDTTNALSLDVSNLADDVWNKIFLEVFESDTAINGPISRTNLIPFRLKQPGPSATASEFSKLLHKTLSAGGTTVVTSKDVLFNVGGKYIEVSKKKVQDVWDFLTNQASELGAEIMALPAHIRIQLAMLGALQPPHPLLTATPSTINSLNGLDTSEISFVTHSLNTIQHSKSPIPKNILDRMITWDWSGASRNMVPRWAQNAINWITGTPTNPSAPPPAFGQRTGAVYNFQTYTPVYTNALKRWAQKKLDHEAAQNVAPSILQIVTPAIPANPVTGAGGTPAVMGTRPLTPREQTFHDILTNPKI